MATSSVRFAARTSLRLVITRSMRTLVNRSKSPLKPGLSLKKSSVPSVVPESSLQQLSSTDQVNSVIRVFCASVSPNYLHPWTVKLQRELTGSGFVLDGERILTNAHVVADQSAIFVRPHGSPQNFPATVVAVGHECDLAILKVEDENFWQFAGKPLIFSNDLPELHEEVTVLGYPIGGDTVSLSSGVVSRIELQQYTHGAFHLLAMQIDAAINPGNSGGPVVNKNGEVVGVAFQALTWGDNLGYVIPPPVIRHFLSDIEKNGRYTGFVRFGFHIQWLDNKQMRQFFKMAATDTGVVVNTVLDLYPVKEVLRARDILLRMDGIPIGNDGTIPFRKRERVAMDFHLMNKFSHDTINFDIIRNGERLKVQMNPAHVAPLVPVHEYDRHPSYFIYSGLVFMALAQPYLHEWGENWLSISPRRLLEQALHGRRHQWDQQVVILSRVLTDEINFGFQQYVNSQVFKFNGVPFRNLQHLYDLVTNNTTNEYDVFELEEEFSVILRHADAVDASTRILERHRIPPNYASHIPPPPSRNHQS